MAAKAKLTLSQFLFRRSNSNLTNTNNSDSANNNNNNIIDSCKNEQCSSGNVNPNSKGHNVSNGSPRKVSLGSYSISANGGGKRHGGHEVKTPPRPKSSQSHHKHSSSSQQHQPHHQQLHSILKKPSKNAEIDVGFGAGKPTRSSLHRSRSNPNPSNNPLKEVSWSCPTLEKRREVILNYFERIILENKQEQHVTKGMRNKPNIPCENVNLSGVAPSGEPIYEEISECTAGNLSNNNNNSPSQSEKMGSLKPKLGPKKVRMNIPQDQQRIQNQANNGQGYDRGSPIYDKLLCRSQSMIEPLCASSSASSTSSSTYSGSGYYDVAPSITTSISSSSSCTNQSLYENCRPAYTSSEGDYVGVLTKKSSARKDPSPPPSKALTTRIAGRSHSFHDNYRSSSSNAYNFQENTSKAQHFESDQIYAKVCKRKKMKVGSNNNDQSTSSVHHPNRQYQVAQQQHQRQQSSSSPSSSTSSSTFSSDDNTLSVQVSCGNVVTMIPVIMPCSSSFSTSCLSLSSSSDNNNEDTMIGASTSSSTNTSSATAAAVRNNEHDNDSNGYIHYDAEKILPDKEIAYVSKSCELQDNNNNNNSSSHYRPHNIHHQQQQQPHHHHHHHQRAFITTASTGNRNNLSVIHLLAAYDPQKEIEEFIPTTPTFTAIIDSTECAPKSISVPVRVVDFTTSGSNGTSSTHLNNTSTVLLTKDEEEEEEVCYEYLPAPSSIIPTSSHHHHSQRPLMVTNCSFSYDAEGDDDDDYDDDFEDDEEGEEDEDKEEKMYSSSTSGSSDEDHQEMKYSFADGRLVNRIKSISFQDDSITKEFLLLTTSDSEDDEELCEHKSLLEMTSTNETSDLLDDAGEKYNLTLLDDEDRGFDSFMDENDGSGDHKLDNPFRTENLKNQRTFAQSQQNVPEETLKKKAASVLDLINSEISDLHMRELELKKLHSPPPPHSSEKSEKEIMNDGEEFEEGSSGEDDFSDSAIEYDGFTTNGSHSSGQVSPSENLNEMGNHHNQEESEQEQVQKPEENEEENVVEENEERNEEPIVPVEKRSPGDIKVRPLEEEEDKSIKFSVLDETPIEREIRLTREREEEFRRLNNLSSNTSSSSRSTNDRNSPSQAQKPKLGSLPAKPMTVSHRPLHETPSLPGSGMSKDLQYEMATARFKREIEESMKREKELVLEGLLKKGASETEPVEANSGEVIPAQEEEPKPNAEIEDEIKPATPPPPTPKEQSPQPKQTPENVLRKPTIAKVPNKLPAARFFSPPAYNGNKPTRITPVVSPIIAKGSFAFPTPSGNQTASVGGSLPIGISRPSFTSLEKYILQSSMNKKTIVASQTSIDEEPTIKTAPEPVPVNPQPPIHEDPLRIVLQKTNSVDEESTTEEKEEEEKPKRRYIPAQDKIQKEIEELVMREKELNRTRAKWKSTLDLPESMKEPEEPNNLAQTTQSTLSLHASVAAEDIVLEDSNGKAELGVNDNIVEDLDTKRAAEDARQVTRVKAPARRRNSWLINQWEERIRQQQQTTTKK